MGKKTDQMIANIVNTMPPLQKFVVQYKALIQSVNNFQTDLEAAVKKTPLSDDQFVKLHQKNKLIDYVKTLKSDDEKKSVLLCLQLLKRSDKNIAAALKLQAGMAPIMNAFKLRTSELERHVQSKEKSKNPFKNKKTITGAKQYLSSVKNFKNELMTLVDDLDYLAKDNSFAGKKTLQDPAKFDKHLKDQKSDINAIKKLLSDEDD